MMRAMTLNADMNPGPPVEVFPAFFFDDPLFTLAFAGDLAGLLIGEKGLENPSTRVTMGFTGDPLGFGGGGAALSAFLASTSLSW